MIATRNSVSNLGFAGFLILRGFKLVGKPEKAEQGRFIFFFEIEKDICDELLTEYFSGDFAKFDNIIVNLKRLIPRY